MSPLPLPPADAPPRIDTLDGLAPRFREALELLLADMRHAGHAVKVFETLRTNRRQEYLFGFGREYDDGRGAVTKAWSARGGWHFYGLAADIVQDDATPWIAPQAFWNDLGRFAEVRGLTWGGRWKMLDLPHVQWGRCRPSPSSQSRIAFDRGGNPAVWHAVGAA